MAEVFEMQREELHTVLQRLADRLTRYAELYTNIKGDFYVRDAYARLREKFGTTPDAYENNALTFLAQDITYQSIVNELSNAQARLVKVNKRIQAEQKFSQKSEEELGLTFWKSILWGGGFFLVGLLWTPLWLVTIGCVWHAISALRALDFDEHVAEANELQQAIEKLSQKRVELLLEMEERLWTNDFTKYCDQPENAPVILAARKQTEDAIAELNRLDFSDYSKFPKKYQNNQDIQRAFEIVEDGRASSWEKCANVMAKEDFDSKHLENQDTMIKNQDTMIDNQEKMLHNQANIYAEMQRSNQQIEDLNLQIEQMAQDMEKHARKQERQMTQIAANQGVQIFQSKKFHQEQLNEMQKSVATIKETIYNRPVQVHYHNTTLVSERR